MVLNKNPGFTSVLVLTILEEGHKDWSPASNLTMLKKTSMAILLKVSIKNC